MGLVGGLLSWRPVRRSAGWLALATLAMGVLGCASTGLAVLLCANHLAEAMAGGGPKCVTGAAVFLPIGLGFTGMALCLGGGMTLWRVVEQWKRP